MVERAAVRIVVTAKNQRVVEISEPRRLILGRDEKTTKSGKLVVSSNLSTS